jgi:RND family efflux transporter MFP subunit
MALDESKKKLLQELRIERDERDEYSGSGSDRRRTPWIIGGAAALLLIAAAAAAVFWYTRGQGFEIEEASAIAPSADPSATAILQATGYVTARRSATVSAQIIGTLKEVMIEEGEHVKAGQVLARLDDTLQQATVAQSEAQLAAARASLGQFQAQLGQARRDLTRNQDLVERKLVSQQALETAATQVDTLQAQVEAQQRQVELATASVRGAHVQLDYTIVRAPFSGVVVTRAAQAGEIVSPSSAGGGYTRTGVGTIVDMDSLEIEVDVNEAYINRVQPQQPAKATLDAYPDWTIPAHVIAIIPTADRSKATVKVRVALDQKDPRILPDMGVRVSFESPGNAGPPPKGVLIPSSAIVERAGKSVVFVVEGDHVRAQQVAAGQAFGDLKLIQELPAGAHVVRAPPAQMNDGARVALRQESST